MKKETLDANEVLGTTLPNKEERKVQISIKILKELANDNKLRTVFIETIENNPDMKSPIAYQFAKAILKQTTIETI